MPTRSRARATDPQLEPVARLNDSLLRSDARSVARLSAEAVADPEVAEDPLSQREREVVHLVARGMTNSEIAGKLFISKRTVETHIGHIKKKLGCGSRSRVIAWALRQSLDLPEAECTPTEPLDRSSG